jgi:hypothetical protein
MVEVRPSDPKGSRPNFIITHSLLLKEKPAGMNFHPLIVLAGFTAICMAAVVSVMIRPWTEENEQLLWIRRAASARHTASVLSGIVSTTIAAILAILGSPFLCCGITCPVSRQGKRLAAEPFLRCSEYKALRRSSSR